jgi:nucleoside-diphosphate-sugar epimerase
VGFSVGTKLFAIIVKGKSTLPLIYIDNLVDAIILAIGSKNNTEQIYNVVDPEPVTKKEYVDLFMRKLYRKAAFIYVPYWFLYTLVWFQEILTTKIMKSKPYLTRYRLVSSQKSIIYDKNR